MCPLKTVLASLCTRANLKGAVNKATHTFHQTHPHHEET